MGKGILKNIFSSGASNLVDSVGNAIDKNVTSKEEKLKLKNEFTKIIQDHEYQLNTELTKRHQSDMTSHNKLSKLIRPMTLIYLLSLLTGLIVADSVTPAMTTITPEITEIVDNVTCVTPAITTTIDKFAIDPAWVTLLTALLVTAFSFYFGGREIQKWLINKNK